MTMRKTNLVMILALILAFCIPATALAKVESLRIGDRGEAVKALQQLLRERGYFKYEKNTGYFGKITEDAVRNFQRDQGLTVDGIAGAKTMASLNGESANTTGLKPTSLARGVEGDEVRQVQQRLQELGLYNYEKITGYYGPITEKAVRDFQESVGIKVDGICGTQTKEKLFSTYKTTTLIPGMRSDAVKALQERLKELGYYTYTVTGFYGQITTKAVTDFQKGNGLAADGIAGKQTLGRLDSPDAVFQKEASRSSLSTETSKSNDSTPAQSASGQQTAQQLIEYAKQFLGRPYRSGASGPDAFDCTGFTCYAYKHFGISLPRSAYDQGYTNYGIKIVNRSELMPGDLLFFNTITDGDLSDHAGIYIGDGKFIHSGSGGSQPGVKIVDLNTGYYATAFQWARRVLN